MCPDATCWHVYLLDDPTWSFVLCPSARTTQCLASDPPHSLPVGSTCCWWFNCVDAGSDGCMDGTCSITYTYARERKNTKPSHCGPLYRLHFAQPQSAPYATSERYRALQQQWHPLELNCVAILMVTTAWHPGTTTVHKWLCVQQVKWWSAYASVFNISSAFKFQNPDLKPDKCFAVVVVVI